MRVVALKRALLRRLRRAFPGAALRVRVDGGFAGNDWLDFLEHERVEYVVGLASNPRLVRCAGRLLGEAYRLAKFSGRDARLLIHYDEAILYNSPYRGSDTTLEDMAQLVGHWLQLDFPNLSATFQEVYLFDAAERCAFQLFPSIIKCMSETASPYG